MNKIEKFPGTVDSFDAADIIMFGAPYDITSSYRKGSRFAPHAIRSEFYGIESFSPSTGLDLEDSHIYDYGDIRLSFLKPEKALNRVRIFADKIAYSGKIPFMIGGEHSLTLPVFSSLLKKYPDLRLIHFDAHTDLRDNYLGEKLSHACVVKRIWELTGDGRIHQFGIRSGTRGEFEWAGKGHVALTSNNFNGLAETVEALKNFPIYLSVDLDVLDPSILPGTGTPEPGGVTYTELEQALSVLLGLNIVGADMVELAPDLDKNGISVITACKVMREMLLSIKI